MTFTGLARMNKFCERPVRMHFLLCHALHWSLTNVAANPVVHKGPQRGVPIVLNEGRCVLQLLVLGSCGIGSWETMEAWTWERKPRLGLPGSNVARPGRWGRDPSATLGL